MKKKKGTVLILLGMLMIAAALGLTAYNIWDGKRAEQASGEIAEVLVEKISEDAGQSGMQVPMFDPSTPMPVEAIDGYEYIGILEIPSLNLSLPVMSEWDYTRLKISPCRFTGSYYADDLVICAHNYATHFSPIKWIEIGADIYLMDRDRRGYLPDERQGHDDPLHRHEPGDRGADSGRADDRQHEKQRDIDAGMGHDALYL